MILEGSSQNSVEQQLTKLVLANEPILCFVAGRMMMLNGGGQQLLDLRDTEQRVMQCYKTGADVYCLIEVTNARYAIVDQRQISASYRRYIRTYISGPRDRTLIGRAKPVTQPMSPQVMATA